MNVQQIENDYSQNGEQAIIIDALARALKQPGLHPTGEIGRFLDLGAFDGLTGSNTRALSDQGWEGVLVEADPRAFVRLLGNHQGNPKMSCVLGAVVGEAETSGLGRSNNRGFFHANVPKATRVRPFYDAGDQTSTVFSAHRLGLSLKGQWWTGTITPYELAQAFGHRFDFINIDIEGSDLDVIENLMPLVPYTKVVCFEDTMPFSEFDPTYYEALRRGWKRYGFIEVVGRTKDSAGKPANTILARCPDYPSRRRKNASVQQQRRVWAMKADAEPWSSEQPVKAPAPEPEPVPA
jgi:FkbM family methyltransferase